VAAVNGYAKTSAGGTPPAPSKEVYDAYLKYVTKDMSLKEQALFLANVIWETGGLQFVEEVACKTGSCAYGKYYGRGYIQLTHDYNYKEASTDIYKDDRLVTDPSLAAKPEGAWRTAMWFWNKRVAPKVKETKAADNYLLGHTIKIINGGLECPANQKAQNRMAIYNEILNKWGIATGSPGKMDGC
jgi:predicted chitinase